MDESCAKRIKTGHGGTEGDLSMKSVTDAIHSGEFDDYTTADVDAVVESICSALAVSKTAPSAVDAAAAAAASRRVLAEAQWDRIVDSLIGQAGIQSLDAPHRMTAFTLLETHFAKATPKSSVDYLANFIAAIDGERDPRCLLKTFSVHEAVTKKLGPVAISNASPALLEEFFDVVSCYFPIAYTPPKSEKNPVNKSELKEAVLRCCSLPAFAKFALPFAMDKLSSPIGETKQDSLVFIQRCCETYGEDAAPAIEPFLSDLWPAVRTEALQGTLRGDTPILNALFDTVTAVCKVVATFDNEDVIHEHLRQLFDGVLNMASVREGFVNAKAYAALVHFAAAAHPSVLRTCVTRLVPLLHGAYLEKQDDMDRRSSILGIYSAIFGAMAKLSVTPGTVSSEVETQMRSAVYETAASDAATQEAMVLCAEACSSLTSAAPAGDAEAAAMLVRLALETADPDARKMVLAALTAATRRPDAVSNSIPSLLLAPSAQAETPRALQAFTAVAQHPHSLAVCVSNCASRLAAQPASLFVLKALRSLGTVAWDRPKAAAEVLDAAVSDLSAAITLCGNHAAYDEALLLFCLASEDAQQHILGEHVAGSSMWSNLVCGLRPGTAVPELDAGVDAFSALLSAPSDEGAHLATAVASRINKADAALPEGCGTSPHAALLARGAVAKGGAAGDAALQVVTALARRAGSAAGVAGQMDVLFKPDVRGLSKLVGCKNTLLWRQKAYYHVLPALLEEYNKAGDDEARERLFACVAAVVGHAAKKVIAADAEKLLPVVAAALVDGAGEVNGNVASSALSILRALADTSPESFSSVPLLRQLVPRLVRCAAYPKLKAVRATSLEVLNVIAQTKGVSAAAVSLKDSVVKELRPLLDDHKRVVRRAAADAVSNWHLLS